MKKAEAKWQNPTTASIKIIKTNNIKYFFRIYDANSRILIILMKHIRNIRSSPQNMYKCFFFHMLK